MREIADRHGAGIVDCWRMKEYREWGLWDTDRMHLGPPGHQRMAQAVLDALGVEWARSYALPWVHRRLTGRSSGDGVSPKRPGLAPI